MISLPSSRIAQFAVLAAALWSAIGASPVSADQPSLDPELADRLRLRLASGTLRWGGDVEGGAPFQLLDPSDPRRVIGFEVELADALADELSQLLGQPIEADFVQYDWVSLIPGLNNGDFDIVISGLEVTDENRRLVRFTRPYYLFAQQLVVRADETRIDSLDDCLDKSVGTLAGTAADRILQKLGVERVVGFEGQVEPYVDLELGRLDAVLLDYPIALFYASTNPALKFVSTDLELGAYGIAAAEADEDLVAGLNVALSRLMASGALQQIYRKWHLWNEDQAELARGPHAEAERTGLGFDARGAPLANEFADEARVDIDMMAASADQWTFFNYAPLLLDASLMTIFLSVVSMALAVVLGLIVCVCRLYGPAPLRTAALVYIEFFRGIPLLLLLFFLYFGLASYGLQLEAVVTAILGFGLNYAAYEAEIYRSAILSVPRGQWEAGRALGMSDRLAFRRIIFPQSLQTAMAPMTNDFIALFKDTSLVSVIAVRELTKEYLILSRSSLQFVELGLLTAALYLAMSVPLGFLSRYFERRWGTPH